MLNNTLITWTGLDLMLCLNERFYTHPTNFISSSVKPRMNLSVLPDKMAYLHFGVLLLYSNVEDTPRHNSLRISFSCL